jgi:hypothetical protein
VKISFTNVESAKEGISMKKCPFCDGEIKDEAIKCKHCRRFLDDSMQHSKGRGVGLKSFTSSYKTSRIIAKIVSEIGWIIVLLSCVTLVLAIIQNKNAGMLAFLPAVAVVIAGLIVVISGQLMRAAVDTADYTGELVSLFKVATDPDGDFLVSLMRAIKSNSFEAATSCPSHQTVLDKDDNNSASSPV